MCVCVILSLYQSMYTYMYGTRERERERERANEGATTWCVHKVSVLYSDDFEGWGFGHQIAYMVLSVQFFRARCATRSLGKGLGHHSP